MKTYNSDIGTLLEKYFEGKSTLEEEQHLRQRLSTSPDEEFAEYKILFETFESEREEKTDPEQITLLHSRLFDTAQKRKLRTHRFRLISGIAATFFIVLSIFLFRHKEPEAYLVINGEKIVNTELALEYVNKSLEKTDLLIRKGLSPLEKIEKNGQKVRSIQQKLNEKIETTHP